MRIAEYAGDAYLKKVEILDIEDIYNYMQSELIEKLRTNDKLLFLLAKK